MKLHVLIDNLDRSRSNCYQHQLLETLNRECYVTISTIDDIISKNKTYSFLSSDKVLCCLKLRTVYENIHHLKSFLGDKEIYIYEQDPWESFKDDSPYKGSYHVINRELNVVSFLNTSKWWSDFLNEKGIKSKFVKMWMLPEYCSPFPEWNDRKIDVGFCGQLHPYRKNFFDYLKNQGITVTILETTSYYGYLNNLSKIKIYVHNEQVNWQVDGKVIPANALWIKDIEAASRGCFSIRDHEEELYNYAKKEEIPTILTYSSFEESVSLIKDTLSTSNFQEKINKSVDFIKTNNGWKSVIDALR
jgi:hypothetical protein